MSMDEGPLYAFAARKRGVALKGTFYILKC